MRDKGGEWTSQDTEQSMAHWANRQRFHGAGTQGPWSGLEEVEVGKRVLNQVVKNLKCSAEALLVRQGVE